MKNKSTIIVFLYFLIIFTFVNLCTTASAALLTISGKLTIDGSPVSGVTVYVNNGVYHRGYTDKFGVYSIIIPKAGTYTVTPFVQRKYIPTDFNKTVSIGSSSASNIDFNLIEIGTGSAVITGRVISSTGLPLEGVMIRTSKSNSVTTDANGIYRFTNLAIGRYFTIPSADNYTFTGNQREVKLRDSVTQLNSFIGYPVVSGKSYSTFYAGVWNFDASVSKNSCALSATSISGKTLITQRKNLVYVSVPRLGTYQGSAGNNAFTLPVSGFKSLCKIKGALEGSFQNSSKGKLSGTIKVTCLTEKSSCSFDVSAELLRSI